MRTLWAVAALLAATAAAMAGDLKYIPFVQADAIDVAGIRIYVNQFGKMPDDSGAVSPNAVCATLPNGNISIAVDADKADAKAPNVLRIDFTGKSKFKDAPTIPITFDANKNPNTYFFGPASVNATVSGVARPVTIWGSYSRQDTFRYCMIYVASEAQTSCKFGDKSHPVRLVDLTADLRFCEGPGKNASMGAGDCVVVDTGDGSFKSVAKTYCGQPIHIDGKWYKVTCDADGNNAAAVALNLATARMKVDQPSWRCTLSSKEGYFSISGGKDEVEVPAGKYTVMSYTIPADPETEVASPILQGGGGSVTLPADTATTLPLGSPIAARIEATATGRDVRFIMAATDAGGNRIMGISLASREMPPAPAIQVIDASGAVVYKNTLEYG